MVSFSEEKFGYDRVEVDQYIEKVEGAYESIYEELEIARKDLDEANDTIEDLEKKVSKLNEENDLLRSNNRDLISQQKSEKSVPDNYSEIGAAMVKAEISAKDTIEKAKVKASRILDEAESEREKVKMQRDALQSEIYDLGQRFNKIMNISGSSRLSRNSSLDYDDDGDDIGGNMNGKKLK